MPTTRPWHLDWELPTSSPGGVKVQDTIHAEIYGLPGNWRWRSLTTQGEVIASRQGYTAVASAVDAIDALFGEDHPIEVVRLERGGKEVCRHWHRGGGPA